MFTLSYSGTLRLLSTYILGEVLDLLVTRTESISGVLAAFNSKIGIFEHL